MHIYSIILELPLSIISTDNMLSCAISIRVLLNGLICNYFSDFLNSIPT